MKELEQRAYIFGAIFAMANRLQVLGNAFDKETTIKQWLFMMSVTKFNAPPTISEISNFIGFSRQNAKRMAVNLEKQGLLNISPDKDDARALRLTLTKKCMDYFSSRGSRELEFINALFTGFDEETTEGLFNGILKLTKNIESMENKNEKNKE